MEETSAAAQRTREVSAHTLYDLLAGFLLSGDGGRFTINSHVSSACFCGVEC